MKFDRRFLPYGVAIGSTAIALLLTLWLEPLLSPIISPLFYIAIMITAWYGGFQPGSVAIVLSILAIDYFLLPPSHQFWKSPSEDLLRLGIFLLVAIVINLLTSNLKESKQKIERLNNQLIQENAQQLGLALSAARMGMWDWNLVSKEVKWSAEHALLLGLTLDAFDGKYETFDARVHHEDRQALNQALQKALQTKSIYQHEFRVIWPDGSIHWLEGRGQGFYDQTGEVVRMTGTIMNIDQRKQTEILLHQKFEQQRLLMEMTQRIRQSLNLPDILQTTVEEIRRFLQCDRVIVFQFDPDWAGKVVVESVIADCMALLPLEIYDPCVGEEYVQPLKQGLVTAKSDIYNSDLSPCHIEFLANLQVRANLVAPILMGEQLWGLLAAHHCTDPRHWQDAEIDLIRQIAIQTGVAIQQANLFEQVQKEVLRIQSLFNTSFDGIVILDKEGKVLDANQRFAQMLGYTPAETASLSIFDWEANLTSEEFQQLMAEFINLKNVVFETRHCRKDGSIYNVEISANVVEWQGEILKFCVCRDITKRKQAEISLQKLNAELEERVIERTAELRKVNDHLLVILLEKEQAYQRVEEQAQLLNLAHDSIMTWNLNSVITFWNHGAELMYGWTKYEAFGQEVHSLLKTRFPQPLSEIKAELWAKGYWEGELIHFTKDNRQITVASRWVAQKDHVDRVIKILEINNDISDRKQAEEALRQQARQENLLWCVTQAIRQSLDINAILNTAVTEVRQTLQVDRATVYRFNSNWSGDFVVESVALNWVKLVECGVSKVWEDTYLQETQGGRFRNRETFVVTDIYHANLQPCHIELLEQFQAKAYIIVAIFSGENLWGLLAIYQNDTPRQWQSWEVELLEQIASQLAIAIQQSELYSQLQIELQERKQTEAKLREAERRWRFLLDNVQLIVVGLDQTGAVNYVNPFLLKLTGYTESEVLGKNWFENFTPAADRQEIIENFAAILVGNTHPYYQNLIVTKSGEERFIAWNNTSLKDRDGNPIGTISIGEDITERQKLEQIKNEFIGVLSHELRTPLTAIRASLGLLKTGIYNKKPDKFNRMIDIALIDSDRLVRLVNDILDLERLESGRAILEKTNCQAADLMQQAVAGVQAIADLEHIHLSIHPTDIEVWAAPDAIIQTLTNLLSNAIKFSPPDSIITVSVQEQTNHVLFQVNDQGRGIPADKLEAIFGRFQQVDASDSRDKGGTGLGLAICRSIIEQHGGKIWAESTLGIGSTFLFTLPLSPFSPPLDLRL